MKIKTYIVRLNPHTYYRIRAKSKENAMRNVWDDIKGAYRYGYKNWKDFKTRVKVYQA